MKCPALYMYGQSGDNLPGNEGHLPHLSLTPDCLTINLYMYISIFLFQWDNNEYIISFLIGWTIRISPPKNFEILSPGIIG